MPLRPGSVPIIFAGMIVLAACTNSLTVDRSPPPSDCGAAALQSNLGLPVTGSAAADIRVGGAPIQAKRDVRVIAPGQPVIQNYSDARLNLETDGQGNLKRATCG